MVVLEREREGVIVVVVVDVVGGSIGSGVSSRGKGNICSGVISSLGGGGTGI